MSLGSYTRSAARATFSAYRTIPIRWRLAGGSAALTFVILACFAAIVGVLTSRQVHSQARDEVRAAVSQLWQVLNRQVRLAHGNINCNKIPVRLIDYARPEQAQIRIFVDGRLECTQNKLAFNQEKAPEISLFNTPPPEINGVFQRDGYLVGVKTIETDPISLEDSILLYARPLSDVNHTLARVQFFLLLGVLGGTVLALLAGLATAQRAMRPIVELTDVARDIERTRDPSRHIPHPRANDEVAELARTLEGMLGALDSARSDTEAMLDRQREFVADASHELRTPLTSVLANLELLTEELDGDQAETAQAALRSTRRMRRLVGDLLLLARADAKRVAPQRPTDLAEVLTDVAAELGPVAEGHELTIDAHRAVVSGTRDDLHRLMLNLLENALRHTPPGTHIRATLSTQAGNAVLVVEDDGPGIPRELRHRVFERFVRSGRDGGRGSGLGLAIVRAVAESHGGSVTLDEAGRGTGARFVIHIPLVSETVVAAGHAAPAPVAQTSTTTGSTIGRRRSRS